MSDFGEVRSLLHDVAPSKEAFARLLGLFRGAPDVAEARRVWMPYALEHLNAWPMATRAMTLSGESSLEGGDATWLPMVRALTLDRQEWSAAKLWDLVTSSRFELVRSFTLEQHVAPELMLHWFAQSAHARDLEELSLQFVKGEGGVGALAESGLALRRLELHGGGMSQADMVALVGAPMSQTLRVLTLASCGLDDDSVRILANAEGLAVDALNLSNNPLGGPGVRALAGGRHASSFACLELNGCDVGEALVAVIESGRLDACQILELMTSGVGDPSVIALANSSATRTLRHLFLSHSRVGPAGVSALVGASWPALTRLDLEGNPLGAASVLELVRSEGMGALTLLDMDECGQDTQTLDDEPPESEPFVPDRSRAGALTEIFLAECGLDARATLALTQTARLASVTDLSLHHDPLGVEGARALAESPHVRKLEHLDLDACGLGDEGFAALFPDGAPGFPSLQKLDLCGNELTDASASVLANMGGMRLRELWLEGNLFGAPWIDALVSAPWSASIEDLRLAGTPLGAEGLGALGRARNLDALRVLDVRGAGVTSEGLRALVTGPIMRGLETLFAQLADCDGDVILALAESPHAASLQSLWLGYNTWDDEVWSALATSPNLANLRALDFRGFHLADEKVARELAAGKRLNPWAEGTLNPWGGAS